jgi:hypothetical protein
MLTRRFRLAARRATRELGAPARNTASPLAEAGGVLFERSSCVREGPFGSLELGLASHPDATYASVGPATVRLSLASGTSDAVFIEATTGGAELEGVATLASIPIGLSRAFEGFAVMRRSGLGPRGLVRATTALPDGRFEVALAPPDGLRLANADALRVMASCEELSLLGDELLSSTPTSASESPTSFVHEDVALSRTPGGKPVGFVSDRLACHGTVVVVEQRGRHALVRVYLDQAVVYGWVDAAALGPAPPLLDGCSFGMIGLLDTKDAIKNRPPRHVCKRPLSLFVHKDGKPTRVGQLTQESCLHTTQARKQDGFVAVELDGRVSAEIATKPGVSFYVTEADWTGCEREPSAGGAWGRCD